MLFSLPLIAVVLLGQLPVGDVGPKPPSSDAFAAKPISKIAFGSCAKQDGPQPIWNHIVEWSPDLMIMLGDNIYGDTDDMDVLREKYAALGAKPEFQRAAASIPMLATWDDHDYGRNDAGREYPWKAESKQVMLSFFGEPEDSERWTHEGIYASTMLGPVEQRVQFILLDLRTFRSSLQTSERTAREEDRAVGPYVPKRGDDVTMLGAEQWQWLEEQLCKPAAFRIICMSTQFVVEFNGWEAWANFPDERKRLIELIKKTRAEGVLFISGDTHWAELSHHDEDGLYPLLDLTSSGLTEVWRAVAPNRNRIVGSYLGANYGQLEFDWSDPDPSVSMRIVGRDGNVHLAHNVRQSELTFQDRAAMSSGAFAGEWETSLGVMTIRVDEDNVSGEFGDGHSLEGTIRNGEVHGNWRRRNDEAHGPFAFRLTNCGRFIKGAWAYHDDPMAADGELAFSWRATRREWN